MAGIALHKAALVALWVETLLHGVFSATFLLCIYFLLHAPNGKMNKIFLTIIVTMFALSSVDNCIALAWAISSFITRAPLPGGSIGYYGQIGSWESILKQVLFSTNNFIANGLLIHRCYTLWTHNRMLILITPCLLMIATAVQGYLVTWKLAQVSGLSTNITIKQISNWRILFFSLVFATNFMLTSLIVGRIWQINKEMRLQLSRKYSRNYRIWVAVLLESGAIYPMVILVWFTVTFNPKVIVFDALTQVVGISSTIIIMRIVMGISVQDVGSGIKAARIREAPRMEFRKLHEVEHKRHPIVTFDD